MSEHPMVASNRKRNLFRSIVERVGRSLWDEPITLVTQAQLDRLNQLERREELKLAERRGDDNYLDQELTNAQPDASQLKSQGQALTPISQWPDEDFEKTFDCDNDQRTT